VLGYGTRESALDTSTSANRPAAVSPMGGGTTHRDHARADRGQFRIPSFVKLNELLDFRPPVFRTPQLRLAVGHREGCPEDGRLRLLALTQAPLRADAWW